MKYDHITKSQERRIIEAFMKPYCNRNQTKGISSRRKSKASSHRKRCLRVDKKAARRVAKQRIKQEEPDIRDTEGGWTYSWFNTDNWP